MRQCHQCGKRHAFKVPTRYWWRYYIWRRTDPLRGQIMYREDGVGALMGRVITNYHESAGKVFCHPCWQIYLREVEHEYRRF